MPEPNPRLPGPEWFEQRTYGRLDGSVEALRAVMRPRTWGPHQLPWLRADYRRGCEGWKGPHTARDIELVIPWHQEGPDSFWNYRIYTDLAHTSAAPVVLDYEAAFRYADALLAARRASLQPRAPKP